MCHERIDLNSRTNHIQQAIGLDRCTSGQLQTWVHTNELARDLEIENIEFPIIRYIYNNMRTPSHSPLRYTLAVIWENVHALS